MVADRGLSYPGDDCPDRGPGLSHVIVWAGPGQGRRCTQCGIRLTDRPVLGDVPPPVDPIADLRSRLIAESLGDVEEPRMRTRTAVDDLSIRLSKVHMAQLETLYWLWRLGACD